MSSYIVNQIKNIETKSYLELGVYNSYNFNSVASKDKFSVDIKPPAMFVGTTDQYFVSLPKEKKFDVIYIDACHDANYVVRDFNNSVSRLNEGGFILAHDFIPDSKELTAQHYCGTAFKVLAHILKHQSSDFEFYCQASDYGLTVFNNPKRLIENFDSAEISYEEFCNLIISLRKYDREELQSVVGAL